MDRQGRPKPGTARARRSARVEADVIIVAIGQGIESKPLSSGRPHQPRGGTRPGPTPAAGPEGVFAGGDCVTGPATVIRAIAAGKAAAANIDEYLGFHHEIASAVQVPAPRFSDLKPRGRVNTTEREACERKREFFACIECGLTAEEAEQESSRCLRCDHFGYGVFKGGRVEKW